MSRSSIFISLPCPMGIFDFSGHILKTKHCEIIGVYLGVRTCELFLCFVAIVRVTAIVLISLFSLFYVTREFHRFLHRGRTDN